MKLRLALIFCASLLFPTLGLASWWYSTDEYWPNGNYDLIANSEDEGVDPAWADVEIDYFAGYGSYSYSWYRWPRTSGPAGGQGQGGNADYVYAYFNNAVESTYWNAHAYVNFLDANLSVTATSSIP